PSASQQQIVQFPRATQDTHTLDNTQHQGVQQRKTAVCKARRWRIVDTFSRCFFSCTRRARAKPLPTLALTAESAPVSRSSRRQSMHLAHTRDLTGRQAFWR
ncbi:unnamed protein product, partial [Scytosiphon promiscuus]